MSETPSQLPRDDLYRGLAGGLEIRDDGEGAPPTLFGHFAVFDEPTEINSVWEGNFIERIAPGAFRKTMKENRSNMRVLFNHGQDPQIGDKPLGPIDELREDETGAYYEVPLMDTSYNSDVREMLAAGVLGASFRFRVIRESIDEEPKPSESNPKGLPERTIKEAAVSEFGPVTFPAYTAATASVRSLTDEFHSEPPAEPQPDEDVEPAPTGDDEPEDEQPTDAPSEPEEPVEPPEEAASATPPEESRANEQEGATTMAEYQPIEEVHARQKEIEGRQQAIYSEHGTNLWPDSIQREWAELEEEFDTNTKRIEQDKRARRDIERKAANGDVVAGDGSDDEDEGYARVSVGRSTSLPDDVYDVPRYHNYGDTPEKVRAKMKEGAKRSLDAAFLAHPEASDEHKTFVERQLEENDPTGELAERMLLTGSPTYRKAFSKKIMNRGLTQEEQAVLDRALSLTTTAGGFAVPYQLDPTVILTSNGVVNPIRQIARVETTNVNDWRAVTSGSVSAAYGGEAVEATDANPAFLQPTANVEKANAFVPMTIEISQDWGSVQSEMAAMFQDAKDALEADKFLTGLGHSSTQPEGLLVAATAVVSTSAATTFAVADLYSLTEALPPRFEPNAKIVGNLKQFNRVRAFDTGGGGSLWVQLRDSLPSDLIGYPSYRWSNMSSALTSGASILTMGDFQKGFVIVDRIGMEVELIPHLFGGTSRYPTGQRGLYAWWRNTSKVLTFNAFRTLKIT